MNTLAYIIYLSFSFVITFKVGWIFYKNGRLYILRLLKGNVELTNSINRILLAGYYLLNLGYATLMVATWQTIHSFQAVLVTVFTMTGKIMLTLALIHFFNMAAIYYFSIRKSISSPQNI